MDINETVESSDKALRVTLEHFLLKTGEGRVRIEELLPERGRFYVTIKYGEGGQTRIDYKTYDVHKSPDHLFHANRNDKIVGIEIIRVVAD